MNETIYQFWKTSPATPSGMTCISNTERFDHSEREEITSFLPDFTGMKVLELASGIGRFTGKLAEKASHVTTIDFAPQLIKKNQETHKALQNITYLHANAMDLSFEKESFDLIFINWLFMYLSDEETHLLFQRIHQWLTKGGTFFFRESTHHTGRFVFGKYTSIYREIDEYTTLAQKYFNVITHDLVMTYLLHCKLTNQHYWRCQK